MRCESDFEETQKKRNKRAEDKCQHSYGRRTRRSTHYPKQTCIII